MIPDRKILAAGDDTPEIAGIHGELCEDPVLPELEATLTRCKTCGGERFYFKSCLGCEDLGKKRCSACGVVFAQHRLFVGPRTRRRWWVRKDNTLIRCNPDNDPVKQRRIDHPAPIMPRYTWKDIIEEK